VDACNIVLDESFLAPPGSLASPSEELHAYSTIAQSIVGHFQPLFDALLASLKPLEALVEPPNQDSYLYRALRKIVNAVVMSCAVHDVNSLAAPDLTRLAGSIRGLIKRFSDADGKLSSESGDLLLQNLDSPCFMSTIVPGNFASRPIIYTSSVHLDASSADLETVASIKKATSLLPPEQHLPALQYYSALVPLCRAIFERDADSSVPAAEGQFPLSLLALPQRVLVKGKGKAVAKNPVPRIAVANAPADEDDPQAVGAY